MKTIIYCRKSSQAADRQVLSIESKENKLLALAERREPKPTKIFRESINKVDLGIDKK